MSLAAQVEARRLQTTAKVLVIDIERLPGIAYAWEPKTRYIAPRNFIEWPSLLCWAARWYGQKRPMFEAAWIDRDRMIQRAWELYDQADAIITYNGVRFDDKHLRSDWLQAGMPPPRPWKAIDLFQQVKRFGFESKSLDSVTRRLGREGKQLHYDIDLAQSAMAGDKQAQKLMREYNIGDIELTEWLADRLRGWMHNHPMLGTFDDKACNQCGSVDLTKQPTNYRAVVIDYTLYRCDNCGANVKGAWHSRSATTRGVQ